MAYTAPAYNAVDFSFNVGAAYTPPNGQAVDLHQPTPTAVFAIPSLTVFSVVADGTITRTFAFAGATSVSLQTTAKANIGMAISGSTTTFFARQYTMGWGGSSAAAFSANTIGARRLNLPGVGRANFIGRYQSIGAFRVFGKTTQRTPASSSAKTAFQSHGASVVSAAPVAVKESAFSFSGLTTTTPHVTALRNGQFSATGAASSTAYSDLLRSSSFTSQGVGYTTFVGDYTYVERQPVPQDADVSFVRNVATSVFARAA